MTLTSDLEAARGVSVMVRRNAVESLVKMMAPFAPCFASEMWSLLKPESDSASSGVGDVFSAGWPLVDKAALKLDTKTCIVMVKYIIRPKRHNGGLFQTYLLFL